MADVFISYSRRDQDFVRRLHEALVAAGRETWVDWEGIPPSAKWMDEVRSAIDAADAFVFVVSPDSAASPVCRDEAEHALAVGKRIVPLVRRDTPEHDLPEAISAHNWLTLREGDDFEAGFATLLAALDTDLEWVKEHTRLVTRARDWEASGRERSRLLRGRDLGRAEQAVAQADRDPRPTPLQTAYVLASHQAEQRGQRIRSAVLSGGLVVALVLAGFALLQRSEAQQNATLADQQRQVAEEQRGAAVANEAEANAQRATAESRRVEALGRQLVAQSLASRSDLPLSLLLALEGLERNDSEEAWENLAELLQYTPQVVARRGLDELSVPIDEAPRVVGLAVSPDRSRLAALVERCVGECHPMEDLWIWDTATWHVLHGPISAGTTEGLPVEEVRQTSRLAFAPDGDHVAFASGDGVAVFGLSDASVRLVPEPVDEIGGIAWTRDGGAVRWLDARPSDGTVRLHTWDPRSNATSDVALRSLPALPNLFSSRSAYLSPGGRWAIAVDALSTADGSQAFRTELFDGSTGARLGSAPTDVIGFGSTDDVLIARGDGLVRVLALPSLDPIGVPIRAVAEWADVNEDRTALVVRESGTTVSRFDLGTGARTIPTRASAQLLSPWAASVGAVRYVGGLDQIQVVDLDRDSGLSGPPVQLPAHVTDATFIALSGDGSRVANWRGFPFEPARTVTVTDVATGRLVAEVRPDDPAGIRRARLGEDGSTLYTLHDSGRLIRTPLSGGASTTMATVPIPASDDQPTTLVVSPAEELAAVVLSDHTLVVGQAGAIISVPVGSDSSAVLSPDGRSIVLPSCAEGRIRVVSLVDGAVRSDERMEACLALVDIAADGSRAIAVGWDEVEGGATLGLYDPTTWKRKGTLLVPGEEITSASFEAATADATVVAIGSVVRHWLVGPASWHTLACRIAGRNLSPEEWTRFLGDEPFHATCSDLPVAAASVAPSPPPGPSPSASADPSPTSIGPTLCDGAGAICYLPQAGHYDGGGFTPAIGFDLGTGWYRSQALASVISLTRGNQQAFSILRGVTSVYDDDGGQRTIDGTPEAFVAWLRSRRAVNVEAVRPATLGGRPALEIDLTVRTATSMFQAANGGGWFAGDDARWRLRVAALDPETTLLAIAESPSETFSSFWDVAGPVMDSLLLE